MRDPKSKAKKLRARTAREYRLHRKHICDWHDLTLMAAQRVPDDVHQSIMFLWRAPGTCDRCGEPAPRRHQDNNTYCEECLLGLDEVTHS